MAYPDQLELDEQTLLNNLLNTTRVEGGLVDVVGNHLDTTERSRVEIASLLLRDLLLDEVVTGVRKTWSKCSNGRRRT